MRALYLRPLALLLLIVLVGSVAFGQVIVSDDFEGNAIGDFPAGWTQNSSYAGESIQVSSVANAGSNGLRIKGAQNLEANIYQTFSVSDDFLFEFYVLLPDTGFPGEILGSAKARGAGVQFAMGSTLAEGVIFVSNQTDGVTVTTGVWHHVEVHADYQTNIFTVTVDAGSPKTYTVSYYSGNLELRASSTNNGFASRLLYFDDVSISSATVDLPPPPVALYSPANGNTNLASPISTSWYNIYTTTVYHLQISTDSTFVTGLVVDDSTSLTGQYATNKSTPIPPLQPNTKYYWRVRSQNTNGWGVWSVVWNFGTIQPPPAPTSLYSPTGGNIVYNYTQISFSWPSSSYTYAPQFYHIVISTDASFSTVAYQDSLNTTSSKIVGLPPLQNDTKYYWKIRVLGAGGWGSYSAIDSFRTVGLPVVLQTSPNDNATITTVNASFQYAKSNYSEVVDSFYVEIASDSNFTNIVVDTASTTTTVNVPLTTFAPGTVYYWRVRGKNSIGTGPWSAFRRFTTLVAPGATSLSNPADGATASSLTTFFSWSFYSGATKYNIQVATDAAFSNIVIDEQPTTTNFTAASPLAIGQTYYWRVRVMNNIAWGPFSTVRSFTTPGVPTRPFFILPSPAPGAMDLFGLVSLKWQSSPGVDSSYIIITTDTTLMIAKTIGKGGAPAKSVSDPIAGKRFVDKSSPLYGDARFFGAILTATPEEAQASFGGRGVEIRNEDDVVEGDPPGRVIDPTIDLVVPPGAPLFISVIDCSELGQSEPSDWLECSVLRSPPQPTGPIPPNGATGVSFFNPILSIDPCPVALTQTNFTTSTSPDFSTDVRTGPSFHDYSTNRPSFYAGDLLTNRTYFVKVDAFNPLGNAPPLLTEFTTANPFPYLHCTGDRPDDQGGFFDAELIASGLDIEPCSGSSTCVEDYYFFSLLTPDEIPKWDLSRIKGEFAQLPAKVKAAAGEVDSLYIWQPLFGFPAIGKRNYLVSLPTRTDSAAGRRYWQRIVALAMLGNGKYYCSNIDSAYSVDNLAPNPPGGGVASPQGGSVRLAWMPNVEKDFKEYVVYRSTDASANVKDLTPIGTVTNTEFVDQNPPSGTVYYFIVARDKNNNDSPPTMLSAVTGVTSLEGVPTEFSLGQNYPNPFNPSTTIQFGIPEQSSVIIQVINTLGQVVDEIANRELSAGFFQITWEARVPSGLYIYRMIAKPTGSEGKEFVAIRKMVLLR